MISLIVLYIYRTIMKILRIAFIFDKITISRLQHHVRQYLKIQTKKNNEFYNSINCEYNGFTHDFVNNFRHKKTNCDRILIAPLLFNQFFMIFNSETNTAQKSLLLNYCL